MATAICLDLIWGPFVPQWQSWVVAMETASSENPKIFTTWPSTEKKNYHSLIQTEKGIWGIWGECFGAKGNPAFREIPKEETVVLWFLVCLKPRDDPGSLISKQNSSSNHGQSTDYLSRITSRNKQKLAYLRVRIRIALKGQGANAEERVQ